MKKRIRNVVTAGALALSVLASGLPAFAAESYTATADGFGGEVTVTLSVEGGRLVSVTAEGTGETPQVGGRALELLPQQMLQQNRVDVDGLSGASFTSGAILTAAAEALGQAGGAAALTPAEETEASAVLRDGVYEETVYGSNFDVPFQVAVTLKDNRIEDIAVTDIGGEWSEYDSTILDSAVEKLIPRILETQSVNVDTITGATLSSSGILSAVSMAIEEAGGNLLDFSKAPVKSEETVVLDGYDVVVVGLGSAGVTAYYSAAESGAAVFGLDCAGHVGGTSIVAGGPLAVNPENEDLQPLDEDGNVLVTDEEAFIEMWKADTNAGEEGGAKPEMIELLVHESGDAVDWTANELGFAFNRDGIFMYPELPVYTTYKAEGDMAAPAEIRPATMYTNALNRAKAMNEKNDWQLELTGTELIFNEDGSIGGVIAESYDGTTYEIHAKAVILCTGGFAGNREMCEQYIGYSMELYGMYQNDGKMLQSAVDNGAAMYNPGIAPMTHNARTVRDLHMEDVSPAHQKTLTAMVLCSDVLAVNMDGDRFVAEDAMQGLGETNILAQGKYYVIVDQSYLDDVKENGFDSVNFMLQYRDFSSADYGLETAMQYYLEDGDPITEMDTIVDAALAEGVMYSADSAEELADLIGAPGLPAALAAYNAAAEAGEDTEFGKDPDLLRPIGENGERLYAIQAQGRCFTTCGGLDVNENIEVLDTEGNVIPGLYACGTDSLGVFFSEESNYLDYGGVAHGWCFTSGKIAGENAAAYCAE